MFESAPTINIQYLLKTIFKKLKYQIRLDRECYNSNYIKRKDYKHNILTSFLFVKKFSSSQIIFKFLNPTLLNILLIISAVVYVASKLSPIPTALDNRSIDCNHICLDMINLHIIVFSSVSSVVVAGAAAPPAARAEAGRSSWAAKWH